MVDTSVVFPHKMGLPYKRKLQTLCVDYLKKIIQENGKQNLQEGPTGFSNGARVKNTFHLD